MPKIDPSQAESKNSSGYPEPHASAMQKRWSQKLGDLAGLTQFGVNLVTLEPGGISSLRHWHEQEDEFVFVTEGPLVLVQDAGETVMESGDMAGFKAGVADGHHLVNRGTKPARFIVVGTRSPDETGRYSDVDLIYRRKNGRAEFTRRDGTFIKEA